MSPLLAMAAMEAALGGVLLLLGRWGGKGAVSLIPAWRTPEDREHTLAMYRRGSWACVGAGLLLVTIALATLAAELAGP